MNKKEKYGIYAIFLVIYIGLAGYNYTLRSQWLFDNILSIAALTFFLLMLRWLNVRFFGFIMFNFALLLHNMGTFGWYSLTWEIFGYDNIVHFIASLVAGYLTFNFVTRNLQIKKKARVKNTVFDEHKAILIFLVIATVVLFGVLVELVEFAGFMLLGHGDGILFAGSGDVGSTENMAGQYTDTMGDIIVNILGTITGVLIYYYTKYKKYPC